MGTVYLNGRWVPEDEARVSVFDMGLQLGVGLFETLRTYGGRTFRLGDHVDRLLASAAALRVPLGLERGQFAEAVEGTIARNGPGELRVRLTVTPGRRGSGTAAPAEPVPTTVVTAAPLEPYPAGFYTDGIAATVADVRQNETDPTARHKTLQYFTRLAALETARRHGAAETLFFNTTRHLACGAISNVFLHKEGVLVTPDADSGLLPGITRKAVLELAAAAGITTEERPVTIQELLAAGEVFLTNSVMELVPVVRIERHTVGGGKPGPVAGRLLEAYRAAAAAGAP